MTDLPENFINEFDDDFTAFYFADHFTVGDTNDVDRNIAIVIRLMDMTPYNETDDDPKTAINVFAVPTHVTDKTWAEVSGDADNDPRTPAAVAECCMGYGSYAHVSRFARGISIPALDGHKSLDDVSKTDDYETIAEWIRANGKDIAVATAGMIGFALDGPQNMIGETGWDWLLPYMQEDYTSATSFSHRG